MHPVNESPIVVDAALANALQFDRRTLSANRNGDMTRDQMAYIRRRARVRLRQLALKFGAALALLVAYIIVAVMINPRLLPSIVLVIGGCLFGLPTIFQIIDIRDCWSDMQADLNKRAVKTVTGRVKFATYGERGRNLIHVERQTFRNLPDEVMLALNAGSRYRIYYAPRTRIVLAAEPVDPNEALANSWESLAPEPQSTDPDA